MNWEQLLSTKRSRGASNKYSKSTDLRSEFEKDYHRIIGSASFRRLQDKTQVFPLDKSDFIRTRLTHSLEVSSLAKSLGQNIGENILVNQKDSGFTSGMKEDICNILQCAGLIHDIGNPPFGHFGETAIREWFERRLPVLAYNGRPIEEVLTPQMRQDFYNFEGNAQALRLVTKLHFLVDEQGMNLTYALLNTIVKYPVSSVGINKKSGNIKDKKMGYYFADEDMFEEIAAQTGTNGLRHPLTFILEAADDIAYKTADIEDAFIKGFITYHGLLEELKELQERYPDATQSAFQPAEKLQGLYRRGKERHVKDPEEYAIKNWIVRVQGVLISCATCGFTSNYEAIMEGSYTHDLFHDTFAEKLMDLLGDMAYRKVFTSEAIYRMEVAEAAMIDYLMDKFVTAVIHYDVPGQNLNSIDMRMVSFISSNYKNAYHYHAQGKSDAERLYLRLLLVTDYICGMTDSYAKRLYQELKAII
ncbi:deoxyguanosinetriphosphate triphosphohydrolase-like protein [Lachnospiraceae bacterium]|uniref:deoxyguanosinetriphosphate triphosphohydrolase n=1 Tax=Extibacter sp. GGCC_0201 TaxID=2731209 RepID=UPI000E53B8F8|nr:deoxyguanosinetriphosphate triphosphohydrolase [Extibacter sp. GGCC_0201]RGU92042.1 deoxyguanosinetriphosphate triphosphohydrolase [Clostridium sp. AF15-17LB]BDF35618.1 deoxyguanosinetriphosphate triphosphohydrolase-like protein [Lachnospiraceae bacterium]BDF39620.1 deoxyguanosinetriphosphate triphosphohydrolase-like protein [Lachnospiraceae bacterium]